MALSSSAAAAGAVAAPPAGLHSQRARHRLTPGHGLFHSSSSSSSSSRTSRQQRGRSIQPARALLDGLDWVSPLRLLAAPMLSAAALQKASESLAKRAAVDEVCRAFQVQDKEELQDLLAALVLSECVYKKLEMPPRDLADTVASYLADFPSDLVHLEALQLSRDDITQNYLVAVGGRSMYVAFMGTKQARDISTDLAFAQEAVWVAAEQQQQQAQQQQQQQRQPGAPEVPSAHRGFLARAKTVPVEELQQLAAASGRRLVLCGHSLGGAVAKLAGLRLLRAAPAWPPPSLRVVCFATPAVGNNALARLVEQAGWGGYFRTYVLPEDQLMRVLRLTQATKPAAAAAAADGRSSPVGGATQPSTTSSSATPPGSSPPGAGSSSGPLQGLVGKLSVLNPVPAVVDVLQQPLVRESAQEQLRRELQAEEASASALDPTVTLDAADRAAAAAAAAAAAMAAAAAAADGDVTTAAAAAGAGRGSASPAGGSSNSTSGFLRALSRRLLSPSTAAAAPGDTQQQQQRGEPQQEAASQQHGEGAAASVASASQRGEASSKLQPPPPPPAAAEAPTGSSSLSLETLGAQNQSLGVALDLQRRWVGYQLQQLGLAAAAAVAPISSARRAVGVFYPFGVYRFLTAEGVLPPDSPAAPPSPSDPLAPQAAAFAEANPGVFAFHRMIAHRARCVYVVGSVAANLNAQGLLLPASFKGAARFAATNAMDVAGATAPPPATPAVAAGSSPGGTAAVSAAAAAAATASTQALAVLPRPLPPRVRLGGVVPAVKVAAAVARPPLSAPPPLLLPATTDSALALLPAGDSSARVSAGPAISTVQPAAAAADTAPSSAQVVTIRPQQQQQQRRSGLSAFLPSAIASSSRGASSLEPLVPLTIRVQACHLRKARQLAVTAFGERYPVAVLSSSHSSSHGSSGGGGNGAASSSDEDSSSSSSYSSSRAGVGGSSSSSSPQEQLGMLASVISRLHESAVAAGKALEGERPRWRLPRDRYSTVTLQVLLPAAALDQLAAAAVAAARQLPPAAAAAPGSSSSSSTRKARSSPVALSTAVAGPGSSSSRSTAAAAAAANALQLVVKTDLQVVAVPIPLQPHVVGVVGSSSKAAVLLTQLLTHSGSLRRQYQALVGAAAAVAAASGDDSSSSALQRWLPQPSRSLQKVKAAASATVAAQRLSTLSKQLLGGGSSADPQQQQSAAKRVRFSDSSDDTTATSSSGYVPVSSGPAAVGPDVVLAGGSRVDTAVAPSSLTQPASRPASRNSSSSISSSSSAFMHSAGLPGVLYSTLPMGRGALLSLPQLWVNSRSNSSPPPLLLQRQQQQQADRSVSQVLKRVTKQLQQQQAAAEKSAAALAGPAGVLGLLRARYMQQQEPVAAFVQWVGQQVPLYNPLRALVPPAAAAASAVGGALARAQQAVVHGHSSSSKTNVSSSDRPGTASSSSRPGTKSTTSSSGVTGRRSLAGPVTAGAGRRSPVIKQKQPATTTRAASSGSSKLALAAERPTTQQQQPRKQPPRKQQAQQQQRPWDVALLAVTWDADFVQLLRHRSALAKLSAAAAAAGVALVPVLLLEGREAVMSVQLSDLRAIGGTLLFGSSSGSSSGVSSSHAASQHHQHQHQQGLLYVDDAAALLATALQLSSVPVFNVPLHGLLSATPATSGSSGSDAAEVLSEVGGVEQQRELLDSLQRLEAHIAAVLQQQQQQVASTAAPHVLLSKL